jgi:oxygen-independent coproporphyrinogen-3 oxidase
MNMPHAPHASPFNEALLRRFEGPGPRYTSYPTADRFVEAFGPAQQQTALSQRLGVGAQGAGPLSVYVHIPFCESVCYYCACNKIITRRHEQAAPYLGALGRELDLLAPHLGERPAYSQLHLGGGSPTFLSDDELEGLMGALGARLLRLEGAEVSIEVDPRTVCEARLLRLKAMGFNRLSFGVQDFDPDVQKAVHRSQAASEVRALMAQARALGFASTNVDLIYGLPKQTPATFERTIEQVCELRPERIALYAYAHLPQRFKPQRRIHDADLPPAADKLGMLAQAIRGFEAAGYDYIGMDHFALPTDALAVAKRQGRLQRNFQGYSTQADCDLIGLGVSAISRLGASYSQNAKTLDEYEAALRAGRLPVVRGLTMSRDDLVRRAVIMGLMCQGRVEFESIEQAHLIQFPRYFRAELQALESFVQAGLVALEPGALQVSQVGWYFVRAVAMVFDHYVQQDLSRQRYSRLI